MQSLWEKAQYWESSWWGDCTNTYGEESKQITYAKKMGLQSLHVDGKFPVIDLQGKSILDIGGGPVSMLLKCVNKISCMVIDPCKYPSWVYKRYDEAGILHKVQKGETPLYPIVKGNNTIIPSPQGSKKFYDEVWIYNVLQHVDDPQKIIQNARKLGNVVRIFEWIETEVSHGHPQVLTEEKLNIWLGGEGKVEFVNENGAVGKAYFGIFNGL